MSRDANPPQPSDEELIERIREAPERDAEASRDELFRRYHGKVAGWCLRICRDPDEAGDLAQEVLLRAHQRLGTFRAESRFSTWLYAVTRSVAINRGQAAARRRQRFTAITGGLEPEDPARGAEEEAEAGQLVAALRRAMARDLEPLEARVLVLHYGHGLTLPAITRLLELRNRSGAKAFIVSGRRKLERRFGRWLARQSAPRSGPAALEPGG